MKASVFPLLRLLSDGRGRAAQAIASELGLSPPDVAGMIERAEAAGVAIERLEDGSFKLVTPFRALDAAEIDRSLGEDAGAFHVEVVDETGSTNDDLLARARKGAPCGTVRVAEAQTAGRGRRQRSWFSSPGGALTFSLLWVFESGPGGLSALPLVVGVSIVRTLHKLGLTEAGLKWPNDLLWRQRKLGGILIETTSGADRGVSAVIGIGLNLALSSTVAGRIDQPAADLRSAGLCVDRNRLLGQLLSDLRRTLATFSRSGFAAFKSDWQRLHTYQDKMVRLELAHSVQFEGKVIGVDDSGALMLESGTGEQRFHAGELSLRLNETEGR